MRTVRHQRESRRVRPILFGAIVGLVLGLGPVMASGTPPSADDGVPDADATLVDEADAAVAVGPDVTVSKSSDPSGAVQPGSAITYTVTVTNAGDAGATGVRLHDDLPTGVDVLVSPYPSLAGQPCTVVSTLPPGGPAQASVDCGPVSLDAGASASVTIGAEVTDGTCGTLTNVAAVEATNEAAGAGSNNTSNEVTNIVECAGSSSPPDLEISKTSDAGGTVDEGDHITYTVTVTNVGETRARGVEVHDVLPRGVGVDVSPFPSLGGERCIVASSIVVGGVPQATVDCGPLPLDPGESATLVVTVSADACGTLTNVVDVEASNEPAELVGPENHAEVTDEVRCAPGIALSIAGPELAHIGDAVTYSFVVTNDGGEDLTNIDLNAPSCDRTMRRTADGNGDATLAVGERWRFTCEHTITAADGDPVRIEASVRGSSGSGAVSDGAAHTVNVLHPDIGIETTASPTSGSAGTTIVSTYVVTNTGDTNLHDVVVSDDTLGTVGRIGSLAAGASAELTASFTLGSSPITTLGTAAGTDVLGATVRAHDSASVAIVSAGGAGGGGGGGSPFTGADIGGLIGLIAVLGALGVTLLAIGRRGAGAS